MNYSSIKSQKLFWDIDLQSIDLSKHKNFVISRIIENGNMKDIYWMKESFSKEEIIEAVKNSKTISTKTATFWKNIFDIKDEILCLSEQYQKTRKKLWPY